jgi:broad specificity phosphatase PhoE
MTIVSKRFIIIRHAESEDNARNVISGARSDCDLTEKGKQDAMNQSQCFETLNNELTAGAKIRLITSGMKRTNQTADLFTEGKTDYSVNEALRERDLGLMDGDFTESERDQWKEEHNNALMLGEETKKHHTDRIIGAVNSILEPLKDSPDLPIMVVHGGTSRRIFESLGCKVSKVKNSTFYECVPQPNGEWKIYELSRGEERLKRQEASATTNEEKLL